MKDLFGNEIKIKQKSGQSVKQVILNYSEHQDLRAALFRYMDHLTELATPFGATSLTAQLKNLDYFETDNEKVAVVFLAIEMNNRTLKFAAEKLLKKLKRPLPEKFQKMDHYRRQYYEAQKKNAYNKIPKPTKFSFETEQEYKQRVRNWEKGQ